MDQLSTAEHDRDLDLLTLLQERPHAAELRLEVVVGDLRPKLHLLELDDVLAAALVLLPLDRLELVATVVEQPAHGRAGLRCHLDQIDAFFSCDPLSRVEAQDAQLVVLIVDQANLVGSDLFVDPKLLKRDGPLPQTCSECSCSPSSTYTKETDGCRAIRSRTTGRA